MPPIMKSITRLLTASLAVSLLAPSLILVGASAAAITSLVVAAGLTTIFVSDYGRSTTPAYTQATAVAQPTTERLPLAA